MLVEEIEKLRMIMEERNKEVDMNLDKLMEMLGEEKFGKRLGENVRDWREKREVSEELMRKSQE